MRNLTDYSNQYILSLMEGCNANPYKATANTQYAVEFNKLIPVLTIWQDFSKDWDNDDRCIFCKDIAFLEFCEEMNMSIQDAECMLDYYKETAFQQAINDIEYWKEVEDYEQAMAEELEWYNHARMMGWE